MRIPKVGDTIIVTNPLLDDGTQCTDSEAQLHLGYVRGDKGTVTDVFLEEGNAWVDVEWTHNQRSDGPVLDAVRLALLEQAEFDILEE